MVDADDLAELAKMPEPPEAPKGKGKALFSRQHMQHSSLGTGIERLFATRFRSFGFWDRL